MKLLLDTHVFLWYVNADGRLPRKHVEAIRDPSNEVYLSVASIWEAVIKNSLGKLSLPAPPATYLPEKRREHLVESLSIDEATFTHLERLPPIHRDPFDRMLIAQSLRFGCVFVTMDAVLKGYAAKFL